MRMDHGLWRVPLILLLGLGLAAAVLDTQAVELWETSEFAKRTFGEAVWKHYLNYGLTEQRLFDEVVTDYERRRMFERG